MIDEKDLKILDVLKENSKLTTNQIAKKINIPITTIHNRIKKLEKEEVIKKYSVELNYKKLGKSILCYVLITAISMMPNGRKIFQEDVARNIKKLPGVEEVIILTGGTDMMIKVRLESINELNDFLIKRLRKIDGVDKTQTMIVLNSI